MAFIRNLYFYEMWNSAVLLMKTGVFSGYEPRSIIFLYLCLLLCNIFIRPFCTSHLHERIVFFQSLHPGMIFGAGDARFNEYLIRTFLF